MSLIHFAKVREKYRESQVSGCNTLQSITWAHKTVNNHQDYIPTTCVSESLLSRMLQYIHTIQCSKMGGKSAIALGFDKIDTAYNEVGKLKGRTGWSEK